MVGHKNMAQLDQCSDQRERLGGGDGARGGRRGAGHKNIPQLDQCSDHSGGGGEKGAGRSQKHSTIRSVL